MYKRYAVRWGPADSTDVQSMTIKSLEGSAIFSVVRKKLQSFTAFFLCLCSSNTHSFSFSLFTPFTISHPLIPHPFNHSLSLSLSCPSLNDSHPSVIFIPSLLSKLSLNHILFSLILLFYRFLISSLSLSTYFLCLSSTFNQLNYFFLFFIDRTV